MNPLPSKHQASARITRRQLLQAGGVGALAMGLPGTVAASVDAKRGLRGVAAEKSCIFVLLCGGPSHLDTWDLKPDAPEDIRGPYRPIASTVPGMRISELHTRLSTLTQHFSLIRSMTHVGNISNHFDAMHHLLSGQAGAAADSPYLGSIMLRVRPSERTIANYVWLIRCVGDPVFCAPNIGSGGHLGAQYMPLFVGSASNHPAMPTFRAPEELQPAVAPDRLQDRVRMLNAVSTSGGGRATRDWDDLQRRAFELSNGAGGREVFDLHRESASVRGSLWHASARAKLAAGAPPRGSRRRLRHRQWLDRRRSESSRRRASRLQLGHARQRNGHGQRLRQRLLRHGLVLAVPR